jgi:hypothetical protein
VSSAATADRVVLILRDGLEVELSTPPTLFGKRILHGTSDPNLFDVYTFLEMRAGGTAVFRWLARVPEAECTMPKLNRIENAQIERMARAAIDAYKPIDPDLKPAPTKPRWFRVWAFPVTVRRFERVFAAQGEPIGWRWLQAIKMSLPTVKKYRTDSPA